MGILGILVIIGIAFLLSNNKKLINFKQVFIGLLLQFTTAFFILKVPIGKKIFEVLASGITKLLELSREGGAFVFGPLVKQEILTNSFGSSNSFIFAFQIAPTIIFIFSNSNIISLKGIPSFLGQRIIFFILKFI